MSVPTGVVSVLLAKKRIPENQGILVFYCTSTEHSTTFHFLLRLTF